MFTSASARDSGKWSGRATKTRNLRVETLEERALLSVVPSNLAFKDVAFTATGAVSATVSAMGRSATVKGSASVTGDIDYTSQDAGTGSIQVTGEITRPAIAATPFALSGNLSDANGKLSGSATLTEPSGSNEPYSATGTFSPKTMMVSVTPAKVTVGSFTLKSANWSGKLVQTDTTPFGVQINTPSYTDGTLTVPVTVSGAADTAASESAAAATISLTWANAQQKPLGKALKSDTISIYWNEASGTYTVSGLTPPTGATQLMLSTTINGKLQKPPMYFPLPSATSAPVTAPFPSTDGSLKKDVNLKVLDDYFALYE